MNGHFTPVRMHVALVLCLGFTASALAFAAWGADDRGLEEAARTWAERNYLVIESFESVESSGDDGTARVAIVGGGEILIHLVKESGGARDWAGVGCEAFDSQAGMCWDGNETRAQSRGTTSEEVADE